MHLTQPTPIYCVSLFLNTEPPQLAPPVEPVGKTAFPLILTFVFPLHLVSG